MSEEIYIDYSRRFTNVYKKTASLSPALREMALCRVMFPEMFPKLKPSDTFAGGVTEKPSENKLPVAFSPQKQGQIGYMMSLPRMKELQKRFPHRAQEIEGMIRFWAKEATFVKLRESADEELRRYLFSGRVGLDEYNYMRQVKRGTKAGVGFISGSTDTSLTGMIPDFDLFLTKGLPGLCERIAEGENKNGKNDFYTAAREACDLFCSTLCRYEEEANAFLRRKKNSEYENNLLAVRDSCRRLRTEAPKTLRDAMQLIVTTVTLTGTVNYGRLDVSLGDFLVRDLESGTLTEEEAISLTMQFFDWIEANGEATDTRIVLGGLGRKNEKAADRFALVAIEAGRRRHSVMPVLTLRFHKDQDPKLFDAALRSISEGCIYPTLYNDDACVFGFMEGMHLSYEDACGYAPIGCGKVVVAGRTLGSQNSLFRYLKAIEAVLHNGRDAISGDRIGVKTGAPNDLDTYPKFEKAFFHQLDSRLRIDLRLHHHNIREAAKEISCVLLSLFTDDCIAKGKSIFEGGVRYLGVTLDGSGLTNSANCLRVLQKLVYEEKRFSLEDVIRILDADYEGYENERRIFLDVEKFGNGKKSVDAIKCRIERFVNERADRYGRSVGFHYCTVANADSNGILAGASVAATCDGRRCGKPFALGNSPMPRTDVNGAEAMLISAAAACRRNGGYATNMHIAKETFETQKDAVKEMLLAYFAKGGLQLNINCFSRYDLENAMKDPESYRHVIVRASGYSARFIDLDPVTQQHLIARTVY